MHARHPYADLTPECVLDAMCSVGFEVDGRQMALNSYENRVYQLGLEDGRFVVAKFYRPGRWTDAGIAEEHAFTAELAAAEIPVVAPMSIDGNTLHHHAGFRFAVFARRGGRAPELEDLDAAAWMGRTLGRMHALAARSSFSQRPRLDVDSLVRVAADFVLGSRLLPQTVRARYENTVHELAWRLDDCWAAVTPRVIRLHGDCHPGNVLWTEQGPTLVDFDDARSGPAIQDLWMLFSGQPRQREAMLEGYERFCVFDHGELALVDALRLMRQIHHAGWIAQRWDDPAFPFAFGFAGEARWWETHVNDLMEALVAMEHGAA